MNPKEKALKIVKRNEQEIQDMISKGGYMFDDELDEFMTSTTARELASCINEYFELVEENHVIRIEVNPQERSCGVLFFSEDVGIEEAIKIGKKHYGL